MCFEFPEHYGCTCMNKRLILLAGIFVFCGMLGAQTATQRIVSLTPSLTLSVRYLNEEAHLVGCTSYCETTRTVPVVATAIKVNVEKVISVKPDLVIATSLTPPETVAAMKKVGLRVEVFPMPHSYTEICDQFSRLGKLLGKEALAKKIVSDSRSKVQKLSANKSIGKKIFIQIGANPLFAVIPNTFMHDYIQFSGAETITSGMTSGSITREAVLKRNPDVIFIVTMGILADEEKKLWENFPQLSATRAKKIFIIDSKIACTPTPVTFAQTLEIISKNAK